MGFAAVAAVVSEGNTRLNCLLAASGGQPRDVRSGGPDG